jgi:hypothetical protein
MELTPEKISCFLFCPYMLSLSGAEQKLIPPLLPLEEHIRIAICEAERRCLLKESEINPRKIIRAWDNTWWPNVSSLGISYKDAQKLSTKACIKFNDYCKYDFVDFLHPTVGVDIESQVQINRSILKAQIDMIKVDLTESKKNILLIDFSRKNMTNREIALDPAVLAKVYAFSEGQGETITYLSIDLSDSKSKLGVVQAIFRADDVQEIGNLIQYIEIGMQKKIKHMNKWNCKECQLCQLSSR